MKVTIQKLLSSFDELERAILSARDTFSRTVVPPAGMLERIQVYETILAKQRSLADELCRHVTLGDWQEVSRHVQLINGLSSMIRDDAKEILAKAHGRNLSEKSDQKTTWLT